VNPADRPLEWLPPIHRSRIGAAHRRRRIPCQDASLSRTLTTAGGQRLALMAVADGHGGSAHRFSDVGSRLACQVAIDAAALHLAERHVASPADAPALELVQRWLVDELAPQIINNWLIAVASDWNRRERQAGAFNPFCYGTTLGLVLLSSRWWAHTGLGDWDLVMLKRNGQDRFVSQEAGGAWHGEATASLCLPEARHCFAGRTAVYPLDGFSQEALGLVLSTDGVRKSCATDADHLALVRYLMGEMNLVCAGCDGEASELDGSLDRISSEGSGDDVTLAMACFGDLDIVPAFRGRDQGFVGQAPDRAMAPPVAQSSMRRWPCSWKPALWFGLAFVGGSLALIWAVGPVLQRNQPSAPLPSAETLMRGQSLDTFKAPLT
jgi:hypothetical protein